LVFFFSSTLSGLFVLSSLAVLLQYAVSAAALWRLASRRERGLGWADRVLSPLTLLSIALLVHAAEASELVTLAAILALGFALLTARRWLASRPAAR
jgi:basic amino acid/polyamine antiporter, APA family